MKKHLLSSSFLLVILLMLGKSFAQVSYSVSFQANAGNPGGLYNLSGDAPGTAGWTSCGLAGSLAANAWSPAVTIPFAFDFYGTPVTQFKVSANGLLTFDATVTGTPPNANGMLPDPSLPNNTICAMWDEFTNTPPIGSNDIVFYRVFGTAPNQQLWIYWYSYEVGNPSVSFNYWAAVLEETTNKIYVIDTYGSTTPLLTTTVGVQLDATTATQYGLNNIAQAGNGSALADNDVWTFLPQTPCVGTPAPGNTISSTAQSCGGVNFTLSLSNGNLGSGITYQWQSSSDGVTYSDISGATSSTYITQQTDPTYYQCVVTCTNGGANTTSTPLQVNTGTYSQCLCIPAPSSTDGTGITNVTFGTINNTTGAETGNYGDYTAQSNDVAQTTTATVLITYSTGFTYDTKIWVDWNDNASFLDAGEEVYVGTSLATNPTTLTATFTVPLTAPLGPHRMRIGGQDTGPAVPCYTGTYGTFEDYTLNVTPAPSCLSPTAVSNSAVSTSGATISWTAPTPAPANGYQYVVSTSATSPIVGATPTGTTATGVTTVTLSGLNANTTYYVFAASDCGTGISPWSNATSFFTGYCVPGPTSVDGTGITNVTFGTINNTTGAEPGNYGDYSAQSNNVPQSTTATVLITYSTGYTYDTKIWVDWNDDLDFTDVGEEVYVGTSLATNPTTLTASFTVPLAAPLGAHRMRIGGLDVGPAVPCYTGTYGTFEDYTINVVPAPTCLSPTAVVNSSVTASGATVSWTAPSPAPDNGYQYYVSTSAGAPAVGTTPTGTVAAGTTSVVITDLSPNTTYYVFVASVCGTDVSPWSSGTSFYTGYCLPTTTFGCTDGDVIARVVLNTLDNNSGTGCPSGIAGYSDYTGDPTLTTTLLPSNSYNCTVYAGQYAEGYAAWIDYNDDLIFDASERIGYSNGLVAGSGQVGVLGSSATFTVSLACTPPAGVHRLRVRAMYFVDGINVDPCVNNSYGEIEDYLITIEPAPTCPSPGVLTASNATTSSIDLSWPLGCSAATNYDFEYGPAGFTQGTGTAVNDAVATIIASSGSYTLNGLAPNTAYDIYYRANCGAGDVSTWSLFARDTTQCINTSSSETAVSCGTYSWNGQSYSTSGTYTYLTTNQYGCDSTVTLTLTVNDVPSISGAASQTICLGDTTVLTVTDGVGGQISWLENGTLIGTGDSIQLSPLSTTTVDVVSVFNNCLSDTTSYTITVNNPTTETVTASTCDTAYVWNNQFLTQSGTYTYQTQGSNGCDSIVTLNLTINTPVSISIADTACVSYSWNGQTYTETGVYTYVGQTSTGCDSTVTLNLVINPDGGSYEYVETCNFPYTWALNGQTYNGPGLYFEISQNQFGCNVYDTLDLAQSTIPTIVATEDGQGNISLNQTGATYQWIDCSDNSIIAGATGATYTALVSGTYACYVEFASGCADTSNCVVVDQIGLVEISKIDVNVNPNPSSGIFNIDFNSPINCKLNVLDASGRVVYSSEISDDTTIDLSFAMTGIYYLEVSNNEFKKIIRVVKN